MEIDITAFVRTAETLEIALKLRNGIGEAGLSELREAFQDY